MPQHPPTVEHQRETQLSDLPLDEILTRALTLDPATRSEYLDAVCGEDPALRSELESLLSVADRFPSKYAETEAADSPESVPLPESIGRYPVVGVVGAGGMGLVYRARDPELEREVALKRLPAGIQADSAELARFRREARALARLRHPNIATVYSLESEPDGPFLTMELVPGQTLHALLEEGPLPRDRALRVGVQIAAAMEAAHAEGIVHRDLKPLNIQVGEADEVKVLDFGLAKALDEPASPAGSDADGAQAAARTVLPAGAVGPVTELGRIVGTPGYISPEQLTGSRVGPPADVWAFGCVLFECLTGNSPYRDAGATIRVPARLRRTLAALELKPDWSLLPAGLPAGVDELLRSCLQVEPGERPSALEVRHTLERGLEELAAPSFAARWFSRRGAIVLVCALVAITGAVMLGRRSGPAPQGIPASSVRQLTFHGNTMAYDLAPDGRSVAYLDETSRLVYLDTETGQGNAAPLTAGAAKDTIVGVGARLSGIRWSPSGQELAVVGVRRKAPTTTSTFIVPRGEHRADALGVADFAGVAWSPDGSRLVGMRGLGNQAVLCVVERASGRYHDVPLDRPVSPARILDWSAGDQIYFKIVEGDSTYAVPSSGGTPRGVLTGRWLRFVPDRDGVCWTVGSQLRYVPLDADGLPTGSHSVLADRVPEFTSLFSVARGGRRFLHDNRGLVEVWLGRRAAASSGDEFRWSQLVRESLSTNAARFSPDGSRIALVGRPVGSMDSILMVHSLVDGSRTILARDDRLNWPAWSPDGSELAYSHGRGMARVELDGGEPRQIPGPRDPMLIRWLPDGGIIYMERDGDLWSAYRRIDPADGSISPLPIDPDGGSLFQCAMAPDGNRVAVAGNRGGHYEVKVWLIDLTNGSERLLYDAHAAPFAWSADARWVYVVAELESESGGTRRSRVLRVAVEGGDVETVADLPEPSYSWSHMELSPDELSLVYTQRRIGRDLWLMDIEPTHD